MKRSLPTPRKGQIWLYLTLLLIASSIAVGLRHCSSTPTESMAVPERRQGGSGGDTLDVALIYGPMSYYMYGDTLGGFNYDMMRLISKESGVPMKYWPVNSLQEALCYLADGRYDMLATLPEDADFKHDLLFSDPLFLDRQVLVQRLSADGTPQISSVLDLAEDTLHIEQDSPIAGRLRNLCREIGDTIYVIQHSDLSSELLTLKVQSGEIRYAVVNERIALPIVEKFDNLDISSPISFSQFQCVVMMSADSARMRKFNKALQQANISPQGAALRKRYNVKR